MEGADTLISIWGPAGVIILALAGAIVWLWRAYATSQDARVADAQKVVTVLLDLQAKQNQLTADHTLAVEAQQTTLEELREDIRRRDAR